MSAILQANYPDATVVTEDFSSWNPPPGGVPVLAGAMVWHHLDAGNRCARAHAALSPNGTLAIVGRGYGFVDTAQATAVSAVLDRAWPTPLARAEDWILADVTASGLFADVEMSRHDTAASLPVDDYCRLVSTFSPFRLLPVHRRGEVLDALHAALASTGESVGVEMATTLTLARRRP